MKNKLLIIALGMMLGFISCKQDNEISPIRHDIEEFVFASGELQWEDAYNISAQTDGVLLNADFEIGNKVSSGDVLAKIENRNNDINAQTAKEQLKIADENLTSNSPQLQQLQQNIQFAESKYLQDKLQAERYQRLYETQSISKLENETMQLAVANSLTNLNALKKQVQIVKQQAAQQQIAGSGQLQNNEIAQSYNQIKVSKSGMVIKKFKTTGDYVRKGEIIATIANHHKVEAVLNVDENSINKIKIGQVVYLKLNTDKKTIYNGRITEILPAFEDKTQSFVCKANFDSLPHTSLFGTQLEANVLVNSKKQALLIPRYYMGFGNKVNVKNKEEPVVIQPGIISTEYVEILSGIEVDDILLPLKP